MSTELESHPRRPRRSPDDQRELDHARMVNEVARTFENAVEEAMDRAIARHVTPLREAFERHAGNRDFHPDQEAMREMRVEHRTLWDERNETRGILKIGMGVLGLISLVSPLLAVGLTYYINHWKG